MTPLPTQSVKGHPQLDVALAFLARCDFIEYSPQQLFSISQWMLGFRNDRPAECRGSVTLSERSSDVFANGVWWEVALRSELGLRNDSPSELEQATRDIGPSFNSLTSDGFLTPRVRPVFPLQDAPLASVDRIRFNKATGEFVVEGAPASEHALGVVGSDDVNVALALAFGSDKPELPGFGLDDAQTDHSVSFLKQKVFRPEWLENTDFGKSFYWADYLLKQTWHGAGYISLKNPFRFRHIYSRNEPSMEYLFSDGIEALPNLGQDYFKVFDAQMPENIAALSDWYDSNKDLSHMEDDSVLSSRLCITLKDVCFSSSVSGNSVEVSVVRATPMIEAALYRRNTDGTLDSNYRINDPRFHAGIFAYGFSSHWNVVCDELPVFSRVAELLKLSLLFKYLREELGVSVSTKTIEQLHAIKMQYSTSSKNYQFVPAPFHHDGCTCLGGVNVFDVGVATESGPSPNPVLSRPLASLVPQLVRDDHVFQPRVRFDFSGFEVTEQNLALMRQGNAPIGPDGEPVQAHHVGQQPYYYVDIYSASKHREVLHTEDESRVDRPEFNQWRRSLWQLIGETLKDSKH